MKNIFILVGHQNLETADPRPASREDRAREGRQALERRKKRKIPLSRPKIVSGGGAREFRGRSK